MPVTASAIVLCNSQNACDAFMEVVAPLPLYELMYYPLTLMTV